MQNVRSNDNDPFGPCLIFLADLCFLASTVKVKPGGKVRLFFRVTSEAEEFVKKKTFP